MKDINEVLDKVKENSSSWIRRFTVKMVTEPKMIQINMIPIIIK